MTDESAVVIISDANVLIDYYRADKRILPLISKHIGTIIVPRPVFEEVKQINEMEVEDLGLIIIEPDFSQLKEASIRGGPLSMTDKLTFIMARDNGFICWTSDAHLRKRCCEGGVQVFWGLEIMLPLCEGGHLSEKAALRVGRRIHEENKLYITEEILERFEKKVRAIFE